MTTTNLRDLNRQQHEVRLQYKETQPDGRITLTVGWMDHGIEGTMSRRP